ncbi:MAG: hypothetical protein M1817_003755 [Caeruleum heppii]|nr:MAG: hypothetical protein M1817_003755 [Caeruleum heppii]
MYPNRGQPGQHPQQSYSARPPSGAYAPSESSVRKSVPVLTVAVTPSTVRSDRLTVPSQDPSASRASQTSHAMANMVTLPPQSDLYRYPAHQDPYHNPPPDMYRGPPQHMTFNQPAPRQRTAIACRYCRRRKVGRSRPGEMAKVLADHAQIRCSGFESSEDGRCTNCQRFHQECIFTPVSSQAQAFVPAHTAYPQLRNAPMSDRSHPNYPQAPPIIYGAHGQPLRTVPQQGYGAEAGYGSSPSGAYPRGYDDPHDPTGRKRGQDEPHTPTLPPPLPTSGPSGGPHHLPGRRGSSGEYQYLDPNMGQSAVSPASSAASYHTSYSQGPQAAYYSEPRRSPPHSSYSRESNSPHGSASTASGGHAFPGLHPPQVIPRGGATPPPGQQPAGDRRSPMSIQNMLDGGAGAQSGSGRSATDHSMLDALMPRRGM